MGRIADTTLAGTIRNITPAEKETIDANIRAIVVEAVVLGSLEDKEFNRTVKLDC